MCGVPYANLNPPDLDKSLRGWVVVVVGGWGRAARALSEGGAVCYSVLCLVVWAVPP